jgi:hypothetical protein
MGLTNKKEEQLRTMPYIIQSSVRKSKDGTLLIHRTTITHIKPVAYYEAIMSGKITCSKSSFSFFSFNPSTNIDTVEAKCLYENIHTSGQVSHMKTTEQEQAERNLERIARRNAGFSEARA